MENGLEMFRYMKQEVKTKTKRMEGMGTKGRNEKRCEAGSHMNVLPKVSFSKIRPA